MRIAGQYQSFAYLEDNQARQRVYLKIQSPEVRGDFDEKVMVINIKNHAVWAAENLEPDAIGID